MNGDTKHNRVKGRDDAVQEKPINLFREDLKRTGSLVLTRDAGNLFHSFEVFGRNELVKVTVLHCDM